MYVRCPDRLTEEVFGQASEEFCAHHLLTRLGCRMRRTGMVWLHRWETGAAGRAVPQDPAGAAGESGPPSRPSVSSSCGESGC
jgi:hypothetical protein